jgi:hypothetical protein
VYILLQVQKKHPMRFSIQTTSEGKMKKQLLKSALIAVAVWGLLLEWLG